MKPIKLLFLIVIIGALFLTGCNKDPELPPEELDIDVTGLVLANPTAILAENTTLQLVYTMIPDNANTGITWSSDNEAVATVNDSGVVSGVAVGEATITLASELDPSINDTCDVTVVESITSLDNFFLYNQLGTDQPAVEPGTTTVMPGLADDKLIIDNTSGDARIDSDEFEYNTVVLYNYLFTGSFRIRARLHRTIDSDSSAKGITIGAYTAEILGADETETADTKLSSMMMRTRTDINAYYSKSGGTEGTGAPSLPQDDPNTLNEYICEVRRTADEYYFGLFSSKTGALIGENTVSNIEFLYDGGYDDGTPTVTENAPVYLGFTVGACTATISNIEIYSGSGENETLIFQTTPVDGSPVPVTGVTVTSNTYLNADETYDYQNSAAAADADTIQLTATVVPSEADDPSVVWSSDNTDIADVDQDGLVSIESLTTSVYGAVTITVTTNDMGFTDTFSMYITETTELVTDITISGAATVMEGLTTTLSADILPTYATNQVLSWESSNTDVATVDADGVVTGVTPDFVTITASATDGSGISDTHDIEVTAAITTIFSWSTPDISIDADSAPVTVDGFTVTFRSSPAVTDTGILLAGARFNIGTHCNDDGSHGGTNDPTTSTHNVSDGEFDFSAATTVTVTYTDHNLAGNFYLYVNNNTTGSDNSVLGGDSRLTPNETLDVSGTCTFTIDPAAYTEEYDPASLATAFIQLRADSSKSINLTSIFIAYD